MSALAGFAAHALLLLGDVGRLQDPDGCESELFFLEALSLAEPRGMRPVALRCHSGLAAIHRSRGRYQDSERHEALAAAIEDGLG